MVLSKTQSSTRLPLQTAWLNDPDQVKVSVVIAGFEYLHRLPATLESLRLQTHTNIECLLLVAEEHAPALSKLSESHYPFEITCYPFYASHTADAYNRAATLAHGQYIQFIQSGDVYLSSLAIAKMVHLALESFIPDLVYMGVLRRHEQKNSKSIFEAYTQGNLRRAVMPTLLSSCLILKESFLAGGRFNSALTHLYDFDWFCRMLDLPEFHFVSEEFFPIEKEPRLLTARGRLQMLSQIRTILYRHYGWLSALLGWWAQKPFFHLSHWLRRKRPTSKRHGHSWYLVSGK